MRVAICQHPLAEPGGGPKTGGRIEKLKVRGEHADDDEFLVIERQLFADYIRRAAKALPPEAVTDEDDLVGAARVLASQEETAQRRFDAEDVQRLRFNHGEPFQFFRLALARQVHLASGQGRYLREDGLLRLQIGVIARRDALLDDS